MSKGGIRPRKEDGSTEHLYKQKWNLGKTTVLRIPIVLKDELRKVAKYFDDPKNQKIKNKPIVEYISEHKNLEKKISILESQIKKLNQEIKFRDKLKKENTNKFNQQKSKNKYQIARKCFAEYLVENKLEILSDRKPRKGTIKRQLLEIKLWLEAKTQENA